MYANQLINEAEVQKQWAPIITEATGIEDKSKLAWMTKYCHYHSLTESVYNTVHLNPNMNLQGMGAPAFPGDPTTLNAFPGQATGSGDKPMSLLPLAMQVAGQTVGLDLVPVVPMQGPMGVLTYLDFVYSGGRVTEAGGKLGNSAPLMIKVEIELGTGQAGLSVGDVIFTQSAPGGTNAAYELTFVGKSRIDGFSIFRVRGATALDATTFAQGSENSGTPIYVAIDAGEDFFTDVAAQNAGGQFAGKPELVKAMEDHIPGFSGASFEEANPLTGNGPFPNIGTVDPYERGVGESTPDNNLGLTLFNKSVSAMTYQVAAAVTREQIQDLKQFGIDAVAQVEAVLVNELTQSINRLILDRIFRLGATNAQQVEAVQGLVLSASFGTTTTTNVGGFNLGPNNSSNTPVIVGVGTPVVNVLGGGEILGTIQRRILTKVLAASNLIATRGRRGPATFAVTSGKMGTVLQDISGFVPYPMSNTVNQSGGSLFPIGSVAGVTIYVDPDRNFDDTTIVIGRKGDGNSPGLVFMPYLMAESVETIAEGTMAPKIAVKSRFALVEAGFHPQTMYYSLRINLFDGVDLI